jgi:tRNA/rRNA methyltransferase
VSELLERVVIVLVRARNPNNIGAVARAMHDFGFRHLRVVNEYAVPFATAKSAVDASEVMAAAQSCASIADAIADCTLVVGTTAVGERALEHRLHVLTEAAPLIRAAAAAANGRVAILFGSEKTGLSNEELSHCHFLLTIPMHEHEDARHLSMNLGQAAAVCLYELVRTLGAFEGVGAREAAAAADVERLTTLFGEVLTATGYTRRHPANAREEAVRRLVRRMNLSAEDVTVWMGILRQTLRKASD